jgi:hypothetical protein
MKSIRTLGAVLATAVSVLAAPAAPAFAVTNDGANLSTTYVAAFAPIFGSDGFPRSGTMKLVMRDGTISGTYSGTSVGPDYLNNRLLPVTGSVSRNDYVQLFIGGAGTLRGSIAANGTISGTLTEGGRLYEFMAAPRS